MSSNLDRRSVLASAGSLAAATLVLPAAPAQAAGFALTPYTDNWRVHKKAAAAKVEQIANGIRASTVQGQIDSGQVALWSLARVAGQWKVTFGYKVVSRETDDGGTFCCFYFNGLGKGTTTFPHNIALWQNKNIPKIGDTVYFRNSRGLRFSFATYNPVAHPELQRRMRLRRYNLSGGTLINPQSDDVFPFTTGVPYLVVVTRKGTRVTVTVTNKNTNDTETHFWEDATWIPKWQDGHIGFRWCGQVAELTDLTVGTA